MEELKLKWCTDLEDILQCPVCFERPQTPIYQCKDGHHICCMCRLQINVCPMCQGIYDGSRSFLAEHLASKLDDIKSSLLQPIPPPKEKQLKVATTQTGTESEPKVKFTQPLAAKGKFPCRIGKCSFEDAHSRILNHLRFHHKDRLCESSSTDGKKYSRQWEIDHLPDIDFDLAFFIPEMGIFFLIITIDSGGNFMGNVKIVHNNSFATQFKYKLEIKGNNRTCTYEGFPRSCKTSAEASYIHSLHIPSQEMRRLRDKNNKVTCIFTLNREMPLLDEVKK